MKKLFLALVAAVALTGCTKEYNTYTEMNRIIKDFKVNTDHWVPTSGPGNNEFHFTYEFTNFTEMDDFMYNNGTMVVYYEYTYNGNRYYQEVLPVIIPTQNPDDPDDTWNTLINYEYSQGRIKFRVINDDFKYYDNYVPPTMVFRAVIIW